MADARRRERAVNAGRAFLYGGGPFPYLRDAKSMRKQDMSRVELNAREIDNGFCVSPRNHEDKSRVIYLMVDRHVLAG
jgi:hypothetical protein